jgi:hypothetical protein
MLTVASVQVKKNSWASDSPAYRPSMVPDLLFAVFWDPLIFMETPLEVWYHFYS